MFKHILVPTDGSPLSHDAVARAVAFAKEAGARITLLYVVPQAPAAYAGMGALSSAHLTQEVHARLDGAARDILEAAKQVARDAGVACDHLALVGNTPYALIIEAAQSRGCDLIFMASHGRRGIDALLLGSETQKVLTHSSIPVLVYR
jgi:nucleotide-binding universal stress UspA family protein